jgi:putative tributyrin esterase
MAFLQVQFRSQALGLWCSANVLLPAAAARAQGREIPVLYLLHGLSDDHSAWMRNSAIERHLEYYAPEFAVIMPAVDRSFYADKKHGNKYWTFVSQELPEIMASMFPLSNKREDTFAAGLSMGGYGVMKLMLNQPERFLACASLSGACDLRWHLAESGRQDPLWDEMADIFGMEADYIGSVGNLYALTEKVVKGKTIPPLYMACGTKDFLYEENLAFLAHLKKTGYPVTWEATPGRAHTWDYWDEQVQVALKWFAGLRQEAKRR